MKARLFALSALAAMFFAAPSWADDKKDDEVAKKLEKIAQLGPGVHAIKKDDKGRITSCVIVGQARISTTLGKTKGIEVARQRAQLKARAEFVKWLKTKVSVYEKSEDETILFLEGVEENDKEALKESGKSVEKTGKRIEAIAEGLMRGLQLLHVEVSDKDKTYTVLYGWDAATAEATKGVKKINDSDEEARKPDANKEGPKKKLDKKIEDKKATSDDAKKFVK